MKTKPSFLLLSLLFWTITRSLPALPFDQVKEISFSEQEERAPENSSISARMRMHNARETVDVTPHGASDGVPSLEDHIGHIAPTSLAFPSTLSPESNGSEKTSLGDFQEHTVEQVAGGERLQSMKEKIPAFIAYTTFSASGWDWNTAFMWLGDTKPLQKKYDDAAQLADPKKKQRFKDAITILEAADSYRNSFLREEVAITQRSQDQQQPVLSFSKTLNERSIRVNKNIGKLVKMAEKVIEFHDMSDDFLEKAAQTQETPNEAYHEGITFTDAAAEIKKAIDAYLLVAKNMKQGHIALARVAEAHAYKAYYKTQYIAALMDEKKAKEINIFSSAFTVAEWAVSDFEAATQSGISENAKKAYIQAANYALQNAQECVEGREQYTEEGESASEIAIYTAQLAATNFNNADKQGISENEKKAWTQAANYALQSAQAYVGGRYEDADNLEGASNVAKQAAIHFKKAASVRAPDEDTETPLGEYELRRAELWAQGKSEE